MITSDLWDLNDLNVSVEDRKIAIFGIIKTLNMFAVQIEES
jgi:hypothetical protein